MDLKSAIQMTQLALAFGRVNRVTLHEDGTTLESDTDHTVMLGLIACELASEFNAALASGWNDRRWLDIGVISQYALVHDLVEVYAGDTQTLVIDAKGQMAKKLREAGAMERLKKEFGGTWLINTLEEYELQNCKEARFIKVVDKILPKLTHLLNGCKAAKKITNLQGFKDSHNEQFGRLTEQYQEVPREVFDLLSQAMDASEKTW